MAPHSRARYHTPVPRRDVEARASGSGPVIEYKLSPEELEKYRAMPRPTHRDSLGERINKPVVFSERPKEEKRVMEKVGQTPFAPSKVDFLKEIAAGKSISKVERAWNMNVGSLHYWIGKWDLKGIKPDRAQQLLDEMALDAPEPPQPRGEGPKQQSEISRLRTELEMLREVRAGEKRQALDTEKRLQTELEDLRRQVADLSVRKDASGATVPEALVRQKDAEIERLQAEVAVKQSTAEEYRTVCSDLEARLEKATQRLSVFEAYEEAAATTPDPRHDIGDPVNHPRHYTAGGIECIDAIEAATTGLSGGLAYNTGAAIKYLWRWFRKNGAEDLRKARWYIDRLIGEVEAK